MLRGITIALPVLLLTLVGAAVAGAGTTYYLTDLGTYSALSSLPNMKASLANGRNANGGDTVVGNISGTGACVWSGLNPLNSSGTLTAVSAGRMLAVNANGTQAVGSSSSGDPIRYTVGNPGTTVTDLSAQAGQCYANGIGSSGVIAFNNATYLLPGATAAAALPGTSSGYESGPTQTMSPNGTIEAGPNASNSAVAPMIWTPITNSAGTITGYHNPITVGAGGEGTAYAVNNAGETAGYYYFQGGANPDTAPALMVAGQSIPLYTGDPLDAGSAYSINNNGVIVGMDDFDSNSPYLYSDLYTGFIWTPTTPNATTGMIEPLDQAFASVLPAGQTFWAGIGVSDYGDVLALMHSTSGGTSQLVLITAAQQLLGDANSDGKVDINDLTIVLANYGQTGMAWSQGAMDGDPSGTVDINDLTIVLANYGGTRRCIGRRPGRRAGAGRASGWRQAGWPRCCWFAFLQRSVFQSPCRT